VKDFLIRYTILTFRLHKNVSVGLVKNTVVAVGKGQKLEHMYIKTTSKNTIRNLILKNNP